MIVSERWPICSSYVMSYEKEKGGVNGTVRAGPRVTSRNAAAPSVASMTRCHTWYSRWRFVLKSSSTVDSSDFERMLSWSCKCKKK